MLEGKFGNCQMDEVLQTIVQGRGTGRLTIEGTSVFGGRVQATYFIEDSHIVHAETSPGTTYRSLIDLFCLREGSFTFAGGDTSPVRDQSAPISDVTLRVTAALDEWNSMRQQISSVDAVFALRGNAATEILTLSGEQWQIMARLDGKTSVRDIANITGKGIVAILKVVLGFVETGLVSESQAPPEVQITATSQPKRRGLSGLWTRK